MKVGIRLKRLREASGLSQRELGKRAGVANATISMIERDQISPSVGSLGLLVDALNITLHRFFAPDTPEPDAPAAVLHNHAMPDSSTAGIVRRLLALNDGHADLHLQHEIYAPGADSGDARRRCFEVGMVVRGEIEFTIGENTSLLQVGDAYHLYRPEPHRLHNQSPRSCEIFSICTASDPQKA